MVPRADLVEGVGLDEEQRGQFQRFFSGQPPGFDIRFVIRPGVLVEPAEGKGMAVGFDHHDQVAVIDHLQGFVKRLRAAFHDVRIDRRDGFQFGFAFGIGLSGSHFRCQFGKPPREFDGRFHGDHHRVVEIGLVLSQSGFLQGFLRVALDAAVAFGQDLFVVRDDMPVAGHRDAAAVDDVLLLGLHVDSRHPGIDLVLMRPAVPVGLNTAQFLLGLFADDKEIT